MFYIILVYFIRPYRDELCLKIDITQNLVLITVIYIAQVNLYINLLAFSKYL